MNISILDYLSFSRMGIAGRLFVRRSDGKRLLYAKMRRWLKRKDVSARTELVHKLDETGFEIDANTGYKVFHPGRFLETKEVIQETNNLIQYVDVEQIKKRKPQLLDNILDTDRLTIDSPFVRFALQQDIITSVSRYLGIVPILYNIDVWYSRQSPATSTSQLYHCDWDDISTIKVFLYADEVGASSGPLTVVGAKQSRYVRDKLNYEYSGKRLRVSDEEIYSLISRNDEKAILGPAGTVAFVDTCQCFHYGSRVMDDTAPRVLAFFQFVTPTAFNLPLSFQASAPLKHLATPNSTLLQRLVLGAE